MSGGRNEHEVDNEILLMGEWDGEQHRHYIASVSIPRRQWTIFDYPITTYNNNTYGKTYGTVQHNSVCKQPIPAWKRKVTNGRERPAPKQK